MFIYKYIRVYIYNIVIYEIMTRLRPGSDQVPTRFRPGSDQVPTRFRPGSDQFSWNTNGIMFRAWML